MLRFLYFDIFRPKGGMHDFLFSSERQIDSLAEFQECLVRIGKPINQYYNIQEYDQEKHILKQYVFSNTNITTADQNT